MSVGTVVMALLAIGWRGAAEMQTTTATALWSLLGAIVGMVLVALLARESARQRIQRYWNWTEDEEDEPRFRWLH